METPDAHDEIPDLVVSIVLYHSPLSELRALLASIASACQLAALPCIEVVCVDNSDDVEYSARCHTICEEPIFSAYLRVIFLSPQTNLGYGAGHNVALAERRGKFHLFLNPDVRLDQDAFRLALDTLNERDDIVLLAPVGFDSDGVANYLAKGYPSVVVLLLRAFAPSWLKRYFLESLQRYELRHSPSNTKLRSIPLASGCCMWVRRLAMDRVGGFDERFFMYFEDYDLSLKLSSLGSVVEHREIHIVHQGGYASRKGWRHVFWFIRSAFLFFNRWGWRWFG